MSGPSYHFGQYLHDPSGPGARGGVGGVTIDQVTINRLTVNKVTVNKVTVDKVTVGKRYGR